MPVFRTISNLVRCSVCRQSIRSRSWLWRWTLRMAYFNVSVITRSTSSGNSNSNKCIAVRKVATLLRELTCHMGSQCYLPPGRGDIPALNPAEAVTRLSDPGGMQGWVDLRVFSLQFSLVHVLWTSLDAGMFQQITTRYNEKKQLHARCRFVIVAYML